MKNNASLFLHGLIIWMIPFIAAMQFYPLREINYPLFISSMTVILTISTVAGAVLYFRNTKKNSFKDAVSAGVFWFFLNIFLDSILFPFVPIRMTIFEFFSEIGASYLMIPIITAGLALGEKKEEKRFTKYVL